MEIKKKELRNTMYYCWKRNMNGLNMSKEINEALGECTVNKRTCQRWIKKFKQGNFILDDKNRSGRPSIDVDFDGAIIDYLKTYPRASSVEIAAAMGHSQSTIWKYLKKIGLRNVCCKWVPHALSDGNKQTRIRICNELLAKFAADNFIPRLKFF